MGNKGWAKTEDRWQNLHTLDVFSSGSSEAAKGPLRVGGHITHSPSRDNLAVTDETPQDSRATRFALPLCEDFSTELAELIPARSYFPE